MRTLLMLRSLRRAALVAAAVVTLLCPASVAAQETIEYYGTDALGSVRVVFDASGTLLGRTDYLPYGEELATEGPVPAEKFTGQARDAEAGQDYFHARMYQPRTGRFNAVDPIYAGLFAPQKWNRYQYVLGNPVSFVDPSGQDPPGAECKTTHPSGNPGPNFKLGVDCKPPAQGRLPDPAFRQTLFPNEIVVFTPTGPDGFSIGPVSTTTQSATPIYVGGCNYLTLEGCGGTTTVLESVGEALLGAGASVLAMSPFDEHTSCVSVVYGTIGKDLSPIPTDFVPGLGDGFSPSAALVEGTAARVGLELIENQGKFFLSRPSNTKLFHQIINAGKAGAKWMGWGAVAYGVGHGFVNSWNAAKAGTCK